MNPPQEPSILERSMDIVTAAANQAGVKYIALSRRTKNRKVVWARMMAAELLAQGLQWGHRRTARLFQQNPTDVLRAKRRLKHLLETSPTHRALFAQAQQRLYGPPPEPNDPASL